MGANKRLMGGRGGFFFSASLRLGVYFRAGRWAKGNAETQRLRDAEKRGDPIRGGIEHRTSKCGGRGAMISEGSVMIEEGSATTEEGSAVTGEGCSRIVEGCGVKALTPALSHVR
jgi:hypothetical protein